MVRLDTVCNSIRIFVGFCTLNKFMKKCVQNACDVGFLCTK